MKKLFVARLLGAPSSDSSEKKADSQLSVEKKVEERARQDSNLRPTV